MLDRDLAQRLGRRDAPGAARRRRDGHLADHDAEPQRGGERDEGAGRGERRPDLAPVGEDLHDRVREHRPCHEPEQPGDKRDDERLARDEPAHLARGGAERAEHRDLAAALRDGQRHRAGDDEQRDGPGDAAERAEDRDEAGAVRRRWGRRRLLRPHAPARAPRCPARAAARARRGARRATCRGAAVTPTAPTCPGSPDSVAASGWREEQRRLAPIARAAASRDAGHAVRGRRPSGVTTRTRRADARAEADVGDDVARPRGPPALVSRRA